VLVPIPAAGILRVAGNRAPEAEGMPLAKDRLSNMQIAFLLQFDVNEKLLRIRVELFMIKDGILRTLWNSIQMSGA
jgi:hypothetical protein